MISNKQHIQALKNYIDDPTATDDLKLDILQWMSDNMWKIATPEDQDDKFQSEIEIFTKLIMQRER